MREFLVPRNVKFRGQEKGIPVASVRVPVSAVWLKAMFSIEMALFRRSSTFAS